MATKLAAKSAAGPKMPKLPKSLGACVDLYKEWSEKRLAEKKHVEAYEAIEKGIKNHIIDNLPKGDAGAVGTKFKAVTYNADVFQVEDWDKLYAYIKKNNAFELLNRMLNQAAVGEHTDALNEKIDTGNAKAVAKGQKPKPRLMLPGIKVFTTVKLSVTKK